MHTALGEMQTGRVGTPEGPMGSSLYKTESFSGMMDALAENPTRRKSEVIAAEPIRGNRTTIDALTRGK